MCYVILRVQSEAVKLELGQWNLESLLVSGTNNTLVMIKQTSIDNRQPPK